MEVETCPVFLFFDVVKAQRLVDEGHKAGATAPYAIRYLF